MRILLFEEFQQFLKISGIGRAFRQQTRALEMNGIEVLHEPDGPVDLIHFNTVFLESQYALRKAKAQGIPVVVHAHSTREDFLNSYNFAPLVKKGFYFLLYAMYSRADLIITPTEYSKSLLQSYGYVTCPIHVLTNGVDLSEYQRDEEKEQAFRDYFGLSPEQKVVMGVGLLFQRKGLQDFIEVARMLPEVTFIWFGKLHPAFQTRAIRKAIRNKPDNVLMPGFLAGDIIKGAFSSSACLLFPSYEETEGIAVLEAMASRLPVIVRDIPVYAQYTSGVELLKGRNNEEFASAVRHVLKQDTSPLTEAAYESVSAKDLAIMGSRLQELYCELLEDSAEQPEEMIGSTVSCRTK